MVCILCAGAEIFAACPSIHKKASAMNPNGCEVFSTIYYKFLSQFETIKVVLFFI